MIECFIKVLDIPATSLSGTIEDIYFYLSQGQDSVQLRAEYNEVVLTYQLHKDRSLKRRLRTLFKQIITQKEGLCSKLG